MGVLSRLLAALFGALCWLCAVQPASGAPGADKAAVLPGQELTLPLAILIARCQGEPVRSDKWVMQHVRAANKLLRPHHIRLTAELGSFSPARCELTTAADRSELAAQIVPGKVTVLVVRRIQDLALASYNLMGVHWRYRGATRAYRGRHWVFLTARARPPVLAHELAHYLGLAHDPAGGNLMTPGPSDPIWQRQGGRPAPYAPLLTRAQGHHLRAAVRRLLKQEKKPRPATAGPPRPSAAPYPPR